MISPNPYTTPVSGDKLKRVMTIMQSAFEKEDQCFGGWFMGHSTEESGKTIFLMYLCDEPNYIGVEITGDLFADVVDARYFTYHMTRLIPRYHGTVRAALEDSNAWLPEELVWNEDPDVEELGNLNHDGERNATEDIVAAFDAEALPHDGWLISPGVLRGDEDLGADVNTFVLNNEHTGQHLGIQLIGSVYEYNAIYGIRKFVIHENEVCIYPTIKEALAAPQDKVCNEDIVRITRMAAYDTIGMGQP